jgi:hypothetical protein
MMLCGGRMGVEQKGAKGTKGEGSVGGGSSWDGGEFF